MKPPVFLRIYLNGKLENVRQFVEEQIVIGRNAENQLSFSDESVSPVHAVIEMRDAGYYISDLGSQLGTFKGGQKIFDEAIESGDEIQVGPYKIEFFIGVPKPTHAPKQTTVVTPLEKQETPPPVTVKEKLVDSVKVQEPSLPFKPAKAVTFAPPGSGDDLSKTLRKSGGTTLEVVVVWNDRIISTHHFTEKCEVTMGSDEKCSIVVPMLGVAQSSYTLVKLESMARVCIAAEMTGDYYKDQEQISLSDLKRKNRMTRVGNGFEFDLAQGEALRLGLHNDLLSIYIRYVKETPAPLVGPLFDLTASESTAVLMSFVIAAIFGLYMMIYSPTPIEDENKLEEQLRKATITFNPPIKKEIIKVEEAPQQEKKIVKVDMKKERTTTKNDAGKAAELRPSPTKPKKTAIVSSTVKQGGTINTGKPAANAKSETRDVTKMGLLSTFGGKGAQKELSKAYDGSGELLGDAAKATGSSGSNEDRAGEGLGGRLKNVGAGGKGSATYGISGVGTQGKGTGTFGAGTGGIGKRGRVDLNIGESEAEFSGSIDREAIRRVIRENLKQFENCYNQALRRNSDAYGKVEITWHIEERGRATHSRVKTNTIGDKNMGECIARVIRGLTFPEPPQDQIAEVTYPFVFASQ
ncbi:MAG: AgmX/PglI C-terminal domain-containing protein [Bdellovibrionales bacterium]|nr:AgmX/PglI C-terminal domain-containing protein [Bdellovibrionales bacterium]